MLWNCVLPFKIAAWTIAGLVLLATVFAPVFGWKRRSTFLWVTVLGAALFIPSFLLLKEAINQVRFGGFAYPDVEAMKGIKGEDVAEWLPPTATDITVYREWMGHKARFRIDEDSLITWLNDFRRRRGRGDYAEPFAADAESQPVGVEHFDFHFGGLGWQCPEDWVELPGPRASNCAGFTIWYSRGEGVAYLRAAYW